MRPSRDWVAITIAVGISTALNVFTVAVLWDALFSERSGLSENGTQVLTGWGGGMVGVLGAYIGARASSQTRAPDPAGEAEVGGTLDPPIGGAGR